MTSSIRSATHDTTATATPVDNTPLDREAVLELLMAQLTHREPLSPMRGTFARLEGQSGS